MKALVAFALIVTVAAAAELPVREVILYKHGVGYFQRSGKLGPGESARLEFKAPEMNDVLKSLTVREAGGGKISGLRYDSMDPLGRKLAEFPFKLGGGQPLSAVLDQLKGARLELQLGNQAIAGAIVNGRLVPHDEKQPEREQVTLLLDSGELRNIDLGAATSIKFSDQRLQQQFRDYLAALTAARSQDKRSVYIDSSDGKAREIVVDYTVPTAVWKSSYRVMVGAGGQPTLEGWAIVDNTTGEDWVGITLALVSGRPVSFVSQLYPPKYITRPEAALPEDQAAAPMVHEGAFEATGGMVAGIAGAPPAPAPMAAPMPAREMSRPGRAQSFADLKMASSTVAVGTMAQAVGELFEYRLSQPVTIRQNESAMLPFLQQKIDGRKLLIYAQQEALRGAAHPSNAVELTNSSGKTLDGGPMTVYDEGAYAGEALMETLKADDKRLISYAVDLGTRLTTAFDSKEALVREIHAARGILTTRLASEETKTYTIRNVDQKAKTLLVEHPLRPEYKVLSPKPVEKTSSAYRFEVKLGAAGTQTLAVVEEREFENSYQVSSLTPDDLFVYARNKSLSEAGRKQLEQIAERKRVLAETDRELKEVRERIAEGSSDEDRLRKNIASLNQVSSQQQQVQEYARKLAALETELAGLRDKQAATQKRRNGVAAEIDRLIQDATF